MTDEGSLSLITRITGPLLFSILTISSFTWFFFDIVVLFREFGNASLIITFGKGAMYMLGVSIGAFFLTVGVSYHGFTGKKVSESIERILMMGVIVGIIVMVALPQITHYYVNGVIERRGYIACEEANYSWLLYKKYVYTNNNSTCEQLLSDTGR